MEQNPLLLKYPEIKELIYLFRQEVQQVQRPADEIVLDDQDVIRLLKISKRTLQYLKTDRIIPFHTLPDRPRTYYLLSDILKLLKENRIESIANCKRIK